MRVVGLHSFQKPATRCSGRAQRNSRAQTEAQCSAGSPDHGRRSWLVALLCTPLVIASTPLPAAAAAALPPEPEVGDCPECIGEVNSGLNACALNDLSCVSSQNDEEDHFLPPWTFDGSVSEAVQRLKDVATGAAPGAGVSRAGQSLRDRANPLYGLQGTVSTLRGQPVQRQAPGRRPPRDPLRFQGQLRDQHTTADGCEYLRIALLPGQASADASSPQALIDAEFLFLPDDNVVDIRAKSRVEPELRTGQLGLSLSRGVVFSQNQARRTMEELRKSLLWDSAPVVTHFEAHNQQALWFEKLYDVLNLSHT